MLQLILTLQKIEMRTGGASVQRAKSDTCSSCVTPHVPHLKKKQKLPPESSRGKFLEAPGDADEDVGNI